MKAIASGKYRDRGTIQQRTVVNTKGSLSDTWSTFKTRWMRFVPLSGSEPVVPFEMKQSQAEFRVELRHCPGVKANMRILKGSRTFDILYVQNVEERDRETYLFVKELPS